MAEGTVRATDDEALAESLWGDDKEWDDERKQYVPTKSNKRGEEEDAKSGVNLGLGVRNDPAEPVRVKGDKEGTPSAGSSSQASTEATPKSPEKSEPKSPDSVPSTGSTSSKARTGSTGASGASTSSPDATSK